MITDFGIGGTFVDVKAYCGTPEFASPEQISAHSYFKSDIYSFGKLIIRVLPGKNFHFSILIVMDETSVYKVNRWCES